MKFEFEINRDNDAGSLDDKRKQGLIPRIAILEQVITTNCFFCRLLRDCRTIAGFIKTIEVCDDCIAAIVWEETREYGKQEYWSN